MKAVICIEMLYPGLSASEKIERIADHGFDAIEFWGWKDKDISAIEQTCRRRNVRVANFSGHRVGSPIARETHEALLADMNEAVSVAQTLDCHTLMVLSNELGEGGAVVHTYPEIHEDEKFANFVELLKSVVNSTPSDLSIVIEPLNTLVDHVGNYLSDMATSAKIVRAVGSPRVGILCDLYHMGVMGANLEGIVREFAEHIGYFHVADFPGRHEPGTGTAAWKGVFRTLREVGYSGDVGFEYEPQGDTDASLEAIQSLLSS